MRPTERGTMSTKVPGRLRTRLSGAWLAVQLLPEYLRAVRKSIGSRDTFDRIEGYCMFIGYSRSGYFKAGFGRRTIFSLILDNSRVFTSRGREWSGYSYAVPDLWQGRYENLRIIGDKRGGRSTRRFRKDLWLVDVIEKRLSLPVRYIHVLRNPYDVISSMHRHEGLDIHRHIDRFFSNHRTNEAVKRAVGEERIFDLRLEDLISEPVERLSDLCRFLGVEASGDYLKSCAGLVMDKPRKSRHQFEWTPQQVELVRERMQTCPMLDGYSFND